MESDTDTDTDDGTRVILPSYISTLVKAPTFLRRTFGNEQKSFRRFLDLPAEIRLMIYAEVFHYEGTIEFTNPMLHLPAPRRAIRNTAYGRQHILDHTPHSSYGFWSLPEKRRNVTGLSGEIMSLLLVNRQIFQEAMPTFYNINTFQVSGMQDFSRMLRHCGARRRVYFSRIEFENRYYGSKELTKKVFNMLAGVKQLQYFAVRIPDRRRWMRQSQIIPEAAAWIELLCDLKCQTVEMLGDCSEIKAYMQEYRAKKAREDEQAETEGGKFVIPSKRSKRVFKSQAIIHDD